MSPLDSVNGDRRDFVHWLTLDRRASCVGARSLSAAISLSTRNERLSTCDCGSHELRLDGEILVRPAKIRSHLVRSLKYTLRHFGHGAGHDHMKYDRDIEAVAVRSEVDLCIDREIGRKRELHPASHEFHRRLVAGRPACGEQLLRIGASARGARSRQLDVQFAVIAAR